MPRYCPQDGENGRRLPMMRHYRLIIMHRRVFE